MSDQVSPEFDPLALIDTAIAAGLLAESPTGLAVVGGDESIPDSLAEARETRKLAAENSDDDSSAQETIILGLVLHGEEDNTTRWARFRQAIGLTPSQSVPDRLWTDRTRMQISAEIDATFRGERDIRQLNSVALVESYRLRVEREQLTGSLQEFSAAVAAMTAEVSGFHLNDFEMAVQILQSKRARAGLKWLLDQLERGLRADKPVEQVVELLGEGVEKARALVSGRLGQNHQFDTSASISEQLEIAMSLEKGVTMSTGIDALDIDILGGVNRQTSSRLLVIAARTGVGKTTLAIASAMGLCRSGADVLFLSCELDANEIGARAFANQAYANNIKIPSWLLEGRGKERKSPPGFDEARDLWIQQEQQGTCGRFISKSLFHAGAEEFVDYLHAAKSRNNSLSCVFMDHFHAMRPMKGFNNRSQEMEARILFLHQSAKACNVDLFLLAQLNREAVNAQKPDLAHINGTDCIAQLASAVWLLEYPKKGEGAEFNPSQMVLHHAKTRNGQRRDGLRVRVEESGLLAGRDYCHVTDCGLPFH